MFPCFWLVVSNADLSSTHTKKIDISDIIIITIQATQTYNMDSPINDLESHRNTAAPPSDDFMNKSREACLL